MFKAWGQLVLNEILEKLKLNLPDNSHGIDEVLKIKPSYRVKDIESMVTKAFIRKKDKYQNPYNDITDKVGCRFVVLLTSQLSLLKDVVEDSPFWDFSRDRDYEDDKTNNPQLFDYQSIHYIVTAHKDIEYESCLIKKGTPCEVQLRTLLQHAYAELAHDTIYKGHALAEPEVHRIFARSMALMETTDDLMCSAKEKIDEASDIADSFKEFCVRRFKKMFPDCISKIDFKSVDFVLDTLSGELAKVDLYDLEQFFEEKSYLDERISEYINGDAIELSQPYIYILFFLAKKRRTGLRRCWPFDLTLLEPIFSDLGIA